jgi:magnesium transporter
MNFVLSKEFVKEFSDAVQREDNEYILETTQGLYPPDISSILDELSSKEAKYVFDLLSTEIGADILSDLDPDIREDFLTNFSANEIANLIEFIDSDDAVDILYQLPVKFREEVIPHIRNEEKLKNIFELLRYDEDTAGGLMAKELIKAQQNWTAIQCIEEIRRQAEAVEKIYSIYVVDNDDILLGRISLKELILSKDTTKVSELYVSDLIVVRSYDDEEEVAQIMQKYDLAAVPVVNIQGKLLGRITIDDVVDVITEQAELDQQAMAGISENIEEDDSVWKLSRARLPWLFIGMLGGLFGAEFIGLFEAQLLAVPAMAFFIPLIMATGGNVGIQSSTIIVQALADSGLQDNIAKRLLKSLAVGFVNGIAIGIFVFSINWLLLSNPLLLSLTVSIALFSVVIIASLMGTITPLILNRMNINPALASGPFITTANDLMGLGVYFSIAKALYEMI